MAVRFFTERVRFPGSARADDTVRIVEGDQVRAVHTRSYAQGATIEDPAPIEALAQGQGAEASLPATPAAPTLALRDELAALEQLHAKGPPPTRSVSCTPCWARAWSAWSVGER